MLKMKYFLLFILVVLSGYVMRAQHYACVAPGQKVYFTNAAGYLRGMRIDSTKVIAGNTVHYPFRTARLAYGGGPLQADTTGGSWLGKEIIETPGGFTYIPNTWGDTIRIKNNALLNESWIFFRDSTAVYYEATVTAWDTMTVNGITDSVKIIRLTARSGTSVWSTDPLHHLELFLGREQGWLQAADLYLFPYHAPGKVFNSFFDCYFKQVNGGGVLNPALLVFRRINFEPAYRHKIYDFNTGDVFRDNRYAAFDVNQHSFKNTRFEITAKQVTGSGIAYTRAYTSSGTVYPGNAPPYPTAGSGLDTLNIGEDALLSDTVKMPEEWFNGKYCYYWPGDSTFCYRSAAYGFETDVIFANGQLEGGAVEPVLPKSYYKNGLGEISMESGGIAGIHIPVTRSKLEAAGKAGQAPCDNNNALGIAGAVAAQAITFRLFPNPAATQVCLELPEALPADNFIFEVYDICGRRMITEKIRGGRATIATGNLPDGIYGFRLWGPSGSGSGKVVIRR